MKLNKKTYHCDTCKGEGFIIEPVRVDEDTWEEYQVACAKCNEPDDYKWKKVNTPDGRNSI